MHDKILLDASLVISLYYHKDSKHDAACAFFELHESADYFFLESTAREMLTVLAYRVSASFSLDCFRHLRQELDITLLQDEFLSELQFFSDLQKKVSFFDASLLYHSKKLGFILATFDRELDRLAHVS